jgi:hypothetical protein
LTDVSDRFYAGLVTKIHEEQLDLPIEEQDHQSLVFCQASSKARNNDGKHQRRKFFAIVSTVIMLDYTLLSLEEFSILSDHLILTFIYNSLSVDPALARHVVHKLQRWALKMFVFSYCIDHL